MTDKEIMEQIKSHEGYREKVYIDSVGVPTGGYGHAFLEGSPLPAVVCDILFEADYMQAVKDYNILVNREGLELNSARRGVVINMIFNLGLPKLMNFKKFIAAMVLKDWVKASEEMLDSRWAQQVGRRALQLAKIMREGV